MITDGHETSAERTPPYTALKEKIGMPKEYSQHPVVKERQAQTNTGTSGGMHPNLHHYNPSNGHVDQSGGKL